MGKSAVEAPSDVKLRSSSLFRSPNRTQDRLRFAECQQQRLRHNVLKTPTDASEDCWEAELRLWACGHPIRAIENWLRWRQVSRVLAGGSAKSGLGKPASQPTGPLHEFEKASATESDGIYLCICQEESPQPEEAHATQSESLHE